MARRRAKKITGPKIVTLKPLLRRILMNIPDLIISGESLKTTSQRFELEIGKDTSAAESAQQYNHLILSIIDTTGEEESVGSVKTFVLEKFGGLPLVKIDEGFTGQLGDIDQLAETCSAFIKTLKVEVKPPPASDRDDSRPRRRPDRDRSRRPRPQGGNRGRRPPRR